MTPRGFPQDLALPLRSLGKTRRWSHRIPMNIIIQYHVFNWTNMQHRNGTWIHMYIYIYSIYIYIIHVYILILYYILSYIRFEITSRMGLVGKQWTHHLGKCRSMRPSNLVGSETTPWSLGHGQSHYSQATETIYRNPGTLVFAFRIRGVYSYVPAIWDN